MGLNFSQKFNLTGVSVKLWSAVGADEARTLFFLLFGASGCYGFWENMFSRPLVRCKPLTLVVRVILIKVCTILVLWRHMCQYASILFNTCSDRTSERSQCKFRFTHLYPNINSVTRKNSYSSFRTYQTPTSRFSRVGFMTVVMRMTKDFSPVWCSNHDQCPTRPYSRRWSHVLLRTW